MAEDADSMVIASAAMDEVGRPDAAAQLVHDLRDQLGDRAVDFCALFASAQER